MYYRLNNNINREKIVENIKETTNNFLQKNFEFVYLSVIQPDGLNQTLIPMIYGKKAEGFMLLGSSPSLMSIDEFKSYVRALPPETQLEVAKH